MNDEKQEQSFVMCDVAPESTIQYDGLTFDLVSFSKAIMQNSELDHDSAVVIFAISACSPIS